MSLEEIFRTAMLANATVAGLIADRLYPLQKVQLGTYPCAAYQRIAIDRRYTQNFGANSGSVGWSRFQLVMWADGPNGVSGALAMRDAFVIAIQGFNSAPYITSPQVITQAPNFIVREAWGLAPATQQPIARYEMDVQLWFSEGA